jgi:hypothetical protein
MTAKKPMARSQRLLIGYRVVGCTAPPGDEPFRKGAVLETGKGFIDILEKE